MKHPVDQSLFKSFANIRRTKRSNDLFNRLHRHLSVCFAFVFQVDDDALDDHADEAGEQSPAGDGEGERRAELRDRHRHVGARHDELAMREIDDPHHPEDDREPTRAQNQERGRVTELVEKTDGRAEHERARQLFGGGLLGVYWAFGLCLVRSQPDCPSQ